MSGLTQSPFRSRSEVVIRLKLNIELRRDKPDLATLRADSRYPSKFSWEIAEASSSRSTPKSSIAPDDHIPFLVPADHAGNEPAG